MSLVAINCFLALSGPENDREGRKSVSSKSGFVLSKQTITVPAPRGLVIKTDKLRKVVETNSTKKITDVLKQKPTYTIQKQLAHNHNIVFERLSMEMWRR